MRWGRCRSEQYLGGKISKVLCGAEYKRTREQPGRGAIKEDEYINLEFGLKGTQIYGKTSKTA